MNGYLYLQRKTIIILFIFTNLFTSEIVFAQCTNWTISSHIISGSTCAANGSFSISISGPDAVNLSNLQYAIPLTSSGFSVTPNNSSTFNNIPPGTYQVSCIATCGGNLVGRNTTVTIPGSYQAPILTVNTSRPTLDCGNYGRVAASMTYGRPPYTFTLTSAPSGYTGPTTLVSSTNAAIFDKLPAGTYSVQASDACGSGTTIQSTYVSTLTANAIPLAHNGLLNTNCNQIVIPKPSVITTTGWDGYAYDTLYKVTAHISNVTSATPIESLYGANYAVTLLSGKTLKDIYGKYIDYTIIPPCGGNFPFSTYIPYPTVSTAIDQNCNVDFNAYFNFSGLICYPVTYSIRNNATSVTYGPYMTNKPDTAIASLPLGSYTLNYTTNDGYISTASFGASTLSGNPYSIRYVSGGGGLTNYIDSFVVSSSAGTLLSHSIELFNGPAGYYYNATWYGSGNFPMRENMLPLTSGTIKFPAGNYVWKITDACGTYYLPITVPASDLYQFTSGIDHQKQTCQGMWIWPTGTAKKNGSYVPVKFAVLRNGARMNNGSGQWPLYAPGDSFLVTDPGTYTIQPVAYNYATWFNDLGGYPNPYMNTYSFTYSGLAVTADINKTQGFLCIGAAAGQGQIYINGAGGIPFKNPQHYQYYLADSGKGLTGPYISSNITGAFTGFGGIANKTYDVKIVDSCGAFAVQSVKILDLRTARLISNSRYVACNGDSVQLSAVYIPGATYSWTGPNGFTSSLKNPTVYNLGGVNTGKYIVTITGGVCSQTLTDTALLVLNPNPAKPVISVDCSVAPPELTIANPIQGGKYKWRIGVITPWDYYSYFDLSDSAYSLSAYAPGSYAGYVTDSITGCSILGDSILTNPDKEMDLSIYSPHLQLCTGDTTILVAQGNFYFANYQWFKDGVAIPGATKQAYVTDVPGRYKVAINAGVCSIDTSDEVVVNVVSYPSASISVAKTSICAGDVAPITASTGTNYAYTWYFNGSTIPGASSFIYNATQTGNYSVTVSNGGCAVTSAIQPITVLPKPSATITPSADHIMCAGDSITFTTVSVAAYNYKWINNSVLIPGANTSVYKTKVSGAYRVAVDNGVCADTSVIVKVNVVNFPNANVSVSATTICAGDTVHMSAIAGAGYTYDWYANGILVKTTTTPVFDIIQTGNYQLRVTDSGCTSVSGINAITVLPKPNATISPSADRILCAGDSIIFFAPANISYNYKWLNGSVLIPGAHSPGYNVKTAGTYRVVLDNGICADTSAMVKVTVVKYPAASATLSAHDICVGDTAHLQASAGGGYTYDWYKNTVFFKNSSSPVLDITQSGSYSVKITDSGCSVTTSSYLVNVHNKPAASITPSSHQYICPGDSVEFSVPADPLFSYTWFYNSSVIINSNTSKFTTSTDGTYNVVVTDAVCPADTSVSVEITHLTASIELGDDTTVCDGNFSIPLAVPGIFSNILWSTGQTTANIVATKGGTYWAAATNKCGTFSDTMHIRTVADYKPQLPDDTLICNKENKAVLEIAPLYNHIEWNTGDTTNSIIVSHPGTYKVRTKSICGNFTDSTKVSFCAPLILSLEPSRDSICEGECISFNTEVANYPLQYQWSFDGGLPSISTDSISGTVCFNKKGYYPITLTVTNAGGTVYRTEYISVFNKPEPRFKDTAFIISYKSQLILPACADALVADWYKDGHLVCGNCQYLNIIPQDYQSVYQCVVYNSGCMDSCTYSMQVIDIPHDVWLPSAFSPNGDGRNDLFHILTDNPNIVLVDLSVYDRWGERVFSTHDKTQGWDGTYHGQFAEVNVYYWTVKYKVLGSDEVFSKKGDVTLVR